MPKAVKDHRSKKSSQGHEAHVLRKKEANASNKTKLIEQRYWRRDCLNARFAGKTWTDKNTKEAATVGLT